MYAEFFELNEQPFNDGYDPRTFCSTPQHEEVLASLIYAVGELKGMVLLTGEAGTGKTLLVRQMLAHFGDRIAFAELGGRGFETDNLLSAICVEFGLTVEPEDSPARLMGALEEYLIDQFASNRPCVLVLDDAHLMSPSALASLRPLNNIESQNVKLLQIVLIGQPELCAAFGGARLRPLRQRCFRTTQLGPLNRERTECYIRHRLRVAGAPEPAIFDREAIDAVYAHSRGIPRLINTVCDNVMLSAFAGDTKAIEARLIHVVADQIMMLDESPGSMSESDGTPRCPPVSGDSASPVAATHRASTSAMESSSPRTTALDHRIAEVEGKISGLLAFRPSFSVGIDELEHVIGRQLASFERRMSGLSGVAFPAPSDGGEAGLADRVASVERTVARLTPCAERPIARTRAQADGAATGPLRAELDRAREIGDRALPPPGGDAGPVAPPERATPTRSSARSGQGRLDGNGHDDAGGSRVAALGSRTSGAEGSTPEASPDGPVVTGLTDASPAQRLLTSVQRLGRLVERVTIERQNV